MAYGIPYSFVPGTKAKADEVNANFIDVLDRIEDTNTRIDNSNNDINERLDETNTTLSQKANLSQLYGNWVYSVRTVVSAVTMNSSAGVRTYSLSSYLPNDGKIYEVLFNGKMSTAAQASKYVNVYLRSSIITSDVSVCGARAAASVIAENTSSTIIPIAADRVVQLGDNAGANANGTVTITAVAYKRIS